MTKSQSNNTTSFLALIIITIVLIGLFIFTTLQPIIGADIGFVFYPTAQRLLSGDAVLYQTGSDGFFNPAHAMLYWMLLGLTPLNVAYAIHIFISFGLLFGAAHLWKDYVGWSMFKTTLAIAGLYTIDHLIRGQMDVLAMFGVVLAFWGTKRRAPYLLGIGATMAMIKPTNVLVPLLLIAWALRDWTLQDILKAAIIPIVTILITLVVFGADWMLRLIDLLGGGAPYDALSTLSTWQLTEHVGLPLIVPIIISIVLLMGVVKHRDLTAQKFAFAIVANLLISNYVAGYHYIVLIPAILCIRNRWLVLVCWLLSLLPLVRLNPQDLAWAMILLPLFVALVLVFQMMNPEQETIEASGSPD